MKLGFSLVFIFVVLSNHLSSSEPQGRISLTRKGFYPSSSPPSLPSSPNLRRPTQRHSETTPKKALKEKPRTDAVENAIPAYFETTKPLSMEGWLSVPKKRVKAAEPGPSATEEEKDGFCGHPLNYGIQCGIRMDQCQKDFNCPGVTKCCLVSDCGFLCVMPKDSPVEKKRPKKNATFGTQPSKAESATTSEGLKLEDITKMPKRESE